MKNKLIQNYVNLYRQWMLTNDGLKTSELNKMTVKELKEKIEMLQFNLKFYNKI